MVVGGGAVAARRAGALLEAGAVVVVVSPEVGEAMTGLLEAGGAEAGEAGDVAEGGRGRLEVVSRGFEPGDVAGAFLVVTAAGGVGSEGVNAAAGAAGEAAGVLVNRADAAERGNVQWMASRRVGPMVVAVHSGGASAGAAREAVERAVGGIDPQWAALLGLASGYRRVVRETVGDAGARRAVYAGLTGEASLGVLRERGEAGWREWVFEQWGVEAERGG